MRPQPQSIELTVTIAIIRKLVARWTAEYHCCARGKSREAGHDDDCPLALATKFITQYDKLTGKQ